MKSFLVGYSVTITVFLVVFVLLTGCSSEVLDRGDWDHGYDPEKQNYLQALTYQGAYNIEKENRR